MFDIRPIERFGNTRRFRDRLLHLKVTRTWAIEWKRTPLSRVLRGFSVSLKGKCIVQIPAC